MAKGAGFIFIIIGAIVAALSFAQVRAKFSITLPGQLKDMYVLIIGAIILIIGFLMLKGNSTSSGKAGTEIPIYKGNQIVGYRKV